MSDLSVLAKLAGQCIALDASMIEAVVDLASVIPVPLAPPHVIGLAAIRSQVVTVVDPAIALGFAAQSAAGRALLVTIDGHRYALRVESVADVLPLPGETVATLLAGSWASVASGRVDLDGGFALRVDPRLLIAPCLPVAA